MLLHVSTRKQPLSGCMSLYKDKMHNSVGTSRTLVVSNLCVLRICVYITERYGPRQVPKYSLKIQSENL